MRETRWGTTSRIHCETITTVLIFPGLDVGAAKAARCRGHEAEAGAEGGGEGGEGGGGQDGLAKEIVQVDIPNKRRANEA